MDTEISISLMCKNDQAIVIVKDQGHGFDNKEILNLLKRFERGQNAQEVIESGLGLTIVDDIMHAHGGTISLSNNLEGGACVHLSFPL